MQRRYIFALLLIAASVLPALWLDMPVARWAVAANRSGASNGKESRPGLVGLPPPLPGEIRKLLALSEAFAHATGVFLIGLTMFVLDPARRGSLLRGACCAYGSGLAADVVKLLVYRIRPEKLDPSHLAGSVWDTFQALPPPNWEESGLQSFPSAHTATAVGLAVFLSAVYPRGRFLFALFAALAAVQRIEGAHHYVSDVLAGALIGLLVGLALRPDPG